METYNAEGHVIDRITLENLLKYRNASAQQPYKINCW
jgi:hypothetical protein